jgi:hypothetical protein
MLTACLKAFNSDIPKHLPILNQHRSNSSQSKLDSLWIWISLRTSYLQRWRKISLLGLRTITSKVGFMVLPIILRFPIIRKSTSTGQSTSHHIPMAITTIMETRVLSLSACSKCYLQSELTLKCQWYKRRHWHWWWIWTSLWDICIFTRCRIHFDLDHRCKACHW